MKRLMITAPASGAGKTTVVCALLQLLKNHGLRPAALKCGPDYIDPMFHSEISCVDSRNLDGFFMDDNIMNYLLRESSLAADICMIEGAMGYYDGAGFTDEASAYSCARATSTPAVLVLDGSGAGISAAAVLKGFMDFKPQSNIRGVIFNRTSPHVYERLAKECRRMGAVPLGYIPRDSRFTIKSRHLGLVTAGEISSLRSQLELIAENAVIDLKSLMALAEAPDICACAPQFPHLGKGARLAVARDRAFCFYYRDNLEYLQKCGLELCFFSPLADKRLPEGISGLLLGGGYPELYLEELSQNREMLASVREAILSGLPTAAECGGFLYLHRSIDGIPMAGVLPSKAFNAGKLTRFGYVTLTARKDNLYTKKGETLRTHEFHYWDSEDPGTSFSAQKPYSARCWDTGIAQGDLLAGFSHLHYWGNFAAANSFIRRISQWKV